MINIPSSNMQSRKEISISAILLLVAVGSASGQTLRKLVNKNLSGRAGDELDKILRGPKPLPAEMDWRKVPGKVTQVRDQQDCSCGWAFATTGILDAHSHHNDSWPGFSSQNLIDCSDHNFGCNGGTVVDALKDIKAMGGLMVDASYTFEGKIGACRYDPGYAVINVDAPIQLPCGDEDNIKKVVAWHGPVAVGVVASEAFMEYKSGVFSDKTCKNGVINHNVVIVGYGTDATSGDYWIIKNSWGEKWGERGYMRLARGSNECRVAELATIAIIHKP